MANVSSSNTTTLYSTTQEVPITPGAPVSAGTVNDTNFTTLYGQVGSAPNAQNNQTVNNLLVTGSAQINQNLTVLGSTTLNNTTINGQTFPLTDGSAGEVLHTDGSGNLYWAVDDNVTYTIDASATTGGANFNLQGSDASTDTIKFSGSGATTVAQTSANEITISSTDSDTTYTIDASATAGGANFNLQGSDASTDTIEFVEGTGVTLTVPTGSEIEIAIGQDVATTAGVTFDSATLDNYLQINGATSGYSQFTAPATGSNLTYVLPSAAGGANTVLTNDGSGVLSWALPGGGGSTFGNITIAVATDNTISTTTGDLILDSANNLVQVDAALAVIDGVRFYVDATNEVSAERLSIGGTVTTPLNVVKDINLSALVAGAGSGMSYRVDNTTSGDLEGSRTNTTLSNNVPGAFGFDYVISNMENSTLAERWRVTRSGDVNQVGNELRLASTNVSATQDIYINMFRGVDVGFRWNETTDTLQLTNDGSNYYDIIYQGSTPTFGDITIGVSASNKISTTTGDLVLDSATNQVTVDANATITGDLQIQGGDLTTNQTTFNLLDTTATTVNAFGAATTIDIGAATGTTTINNDLTIDGSTTIKGSTSGYSTFSAPATGSNLTYVLPGVAGAANEVLTNDGSGNLSWALPGGGGSTFGNITVGVVTDNTISTTTGDLVLDSSSNNVSVDADLTTPLTTFNLINTTATTVNAFGAATTVNIGNASGNVVVAGDLQVTGNDIKASTGNTNITLTDNTLTTFAGDIRINGNDIQASDGNNNITLTSNTLTTFAGDIRINGNDIQASDGNNNITLTSNTLTTFAGDIKITGNDIQNSAGNALISMPAIGNTVTFAGDIRVNGNDILASDGLINTTLTSNTLTTFAGDIKVTGNDIQASDGLNNITMTSNTLTTFAGDIKVTGNDIQDSTNTNAVSLMPNGVRSQRFVRGAIRDATADAAGDVGSLAGVAYSGVSLSNDTTYDTTLNAFWLRNYSGSSLADPRTLMLMEGARGTSASPLAINTNNQIFRLIGSGFVGSGTWATDSTATGGGVVYPFELASLATQSWSTTQWGTKLRVRVQPNGVTVSSAPDSRSTIIDHNPTTTSYYRSDSWSFETRETAAGGTGTVQFTVDSSGNMVLTGDLRINGNDISNSTGNTAITMASGATPTVTFSGDIRINGSDILNSTGDTTITMFTGANANTVFAGNIKVNGDNIKASDGSDNITLTSGTLTTFAGDIKITGNDIQASDGNTNITLTSNTLTTLAGDLQINGNDIKNSTGNTAITMATGAAPDVSFAGDIQIIGDGILDGNGDLILGFLLGPQTTGRIVKNTTGAFFTCEYFDADSISDAAQFETYVQPTVGSTLTGWNIGKFKFHGYDGTNFQVGGELIANATEDWTATEQGTELVFSQRKVGAATDLQTLTLRSDVTTLQSDQFVFNDSMLSQLVSIDSSGNVDIAGDLTVGGNIVYDYTAYGDGRLSTTSTSNVALDSWATATYQSASYSVTVKDTVTGDVQVTKIDMFHAAGTAYINQYSNMTSAADLATFDASISGANAILGITPASTNNTQFTFSRTLTKV